MAVFYQKFILHLYRLSIRLPMSSMNEPPSLPLPSSDPTNMVLNPSSDGNPNMKTKLCRHWKRGQCTFSNDCRFAHGAKELRGSAEVYKTSICRFWLMGACVAGNRCRHAHGDHELRDRSPTNLMDVNDTAPTTFPPDATPSVWNNYSTAAGSPPHHRISAKGSSNAVPSPTSQNGNKARVSISNTTQDGNGMSSSPVFTPTNANSLGLPVTLPPLPLSISIGEDNIPRNPPLTAPAGSSGLRLPIQALNMGNHFNHSNSYISNDNGSSSRMDISREMHYGGYEVSTPSLAFHQQLHNNNLYYNSLNGVDSPSRSNGFMTPLHPSGPQMASLLSIHNNPSANYISSPLNYIQGNNTDGEHNLNFYNAISSPTNATDNLMDAVNALVAKPAASNFALGVGDVTTRSWDWQPLHTQGEHSVNTNFNDSIAISNKHTVEHSININKNIENTNEDKLSSNSTSFAAQQQKSKAYTTTAAESYSLRRGRPTFFIE